MGQVYVRQNPSPLHWDMIGHQWENFVNYVLHHAASLRGTKQYWKRSRLNFMVDVLDIFLIYSAADLQWPELARLAGAENAGQTE